MGTDRLAITVARQLCRNAKITSVTSTTARTSSNSTCSTDARMPAVRSLRMRTSSDEGSAACSSGNCALIASTVWITLAPGWRCTLTMMAGVSSAQAASCMFSALLTTWAMSVRRTGAPFL